MYFVNFFIAIFLFQLVNVSFAGNVCCEDYSVTVKKLNCGRKNSAIIEPKINATLTKDCNLILDACISLDRSFETAKVSFVASAFIAILYEATNVDVCEALHLLEIPVECPITEPGRFCSTADNPIDISDFAYLLPMAQFADVEVKGGKIVYNGDTSCVDTFTMTISIKKKKK